MAKRPSPIPVSQQYTLWFITTAILNAGGTADDDIDKDTQEYHKTVSLEVGERLSTIAIGLYAANQPTVFKEFYSRFSTELTKLLRQYNWLSDTGKIAALDTWKITATLGKMSADLVDEFDSKVKWEPPAPTNPQ
jgi:hypothetical protein